MHINNTQPLYCQEADLRKFYYYPPAGGTYPNGWLWFDGNHHGMINFWTWDSLVTERMNRPSPVTVTMWGYYSPASGNGTIFAQFRNDSTADITGRAIFVLTEDSLYYPAINFDSIHNHVARDYLPDQNGTVITVAPGDSVTVSRPFTVVPSWIENNCNILAWLQNDAPQPDSTREIWQGAMIPLTILDIAENTAAASPVLQQLRAAPNPCVDHTEINFPQSLSRFGKAGIYDAQGRSIAALGLPSGTNTASVIWHCRRDDGTRVAPGVYFAVVGEGDATVSCKIIIR